MLRKSLTNLTTAVLVLLFSYAATSKLITFKDTSHQIAQVSILHPIANFIAWSVPAIELGVSFLLLIPTRRTLGLYLSFVLMLLFTIYISWILLMNDTLPCSCGGVISNLSWKFHLLLNIAVLLLVYLSLHFTTSQNSQPNISFTKSKEIAQ
jgi:hypothetical protein